MGLSWQQGPLARSPNGRFLVAEPLPERLLYAEPLRRRLRVELGRRAIAVSDDVVLLHEPGRYPVAYFPLADVEPGMLKKTGHVTHHPDLGATRWFTVRGGDGRVVPRGAWHHTDVPAHAAELRDTVAFAWAAMDAFYEEDERILGHAADPYHRIDVRSASRHLVVRNGNGVIAETQKPLVLYESGFAPRWYVPREDVEPMALTSVEGRTFCPYKGLASYYDIAEAHRAAWSYRSPFKEVGRIADLVSFEPDRVTVVLDGERLKLAPGQTVVTHGADRDLTVDQAGGILLG
jgi:uncharacterized protein (DUF427 family)